MSPIDLTGKRIIVTGGARGLGKVAALSYVRANAQVLVTATDQAALDRVVAESAGAPGVAVALQADLRVPEDRARIVDAARDAFGGVDVLFNNAGVSVPIIRTQPPTAPERRFWSFSIEEYRWFLEVNTVAGLELACLVAPEMVERGWGRIICDTTSLDTMLKAGSAPYGGSKAAMEAMTAVMSGDLAGTGVTANVLVPGGMADTRMADHAGIPRDRLISPDAMAAPGLWLASRASDGVTGRRFVASLWDADLPCEEAVAAAGAPIAWLGYGVQSAVVS